MIYHKFQKITWNTNFKSVDNILIPNHYEPEVLFVGTFNPDIPWNDADFYYGRNGYMWPILSNLFTHNSQFHKEKRFKNYREPSITEIYSICSNAKIIFGDLINKIHSENIDFNLKTKSVILDKSYELSDYSDKKLYNSPQIQDS